MRKIHVLLYLNVKIRKGRDSWSVLPAVTGLLSFTVCIGKALAIYIYILFWLNVAFIFFMVQIVRTMGWIWHDKTDKYKFIYL